MRAPDPVAFWATVDGTRIAIVDADLGRSYSYADVDRDADAMATLLRAAGVRRTDRIAVLAQNRYEFLPLFYACLRVGAVLVPLNWRLAVPERLRVLADCSPALVIAEERFRAHGGPPGDEAADRSAQWRDIDEFVAAAQQRRAHGVADAGHGVADDAAGFEDIAMLLYTSGSTGAPKGAMISHRQIHWNAVATTTAWQLGADDVGPASTPFFHTGGWNVFTLPLLARGGRVVLFTSFDPARYLAMLHEHGVTVTFGVPTQLAMLRESPDWGRSLPRLRWFISGGAPCPPSLKDAVRAAGYRMREGYGLTECGPNCFATTDTTAVERPASVGWPVPFLEMRLRRDDGGLADVDAIGELELRGPQLFSGYFNAPEKTAEVMTADGWLRTGDLASRDASGVYTIRGRRKEMFISGGENVFPGEVEAALLECDGVLEACVIGVPDARWGEVGCAVVALRDATRDGAALLTAARERLAGFKVPRRVVIVDALPRLGSGKIDRHAARRLIEDHVHA